MARKTTRKTKKFTVDPETASAALSLDIDPRVLQSPVAEKMLSAETLDTLRTLWMIKTLLESGRAQIVSKGTKRRQ